jgi:ketosteroid isomerase-like protein
MEASRIVAVALLVVMIGCVGEEAGGPDDVEAGRKALMQADLEFADAAARRGLEGWLSRMAQGAFRLVLGQPAIRGLQAIATADSVLFSPRIRLTWVPVDGGLFEGGRDGFTTGTYEVWQVEADGSEVRAGTGSYITIWKKDQAGRWKIVLDGGAADADPPRSSE